MMDKIVFATANEGKVKEIKEILKDFPIEVLSMKEMGITANIEEDGTTFEENSLIKARAISKLTGLPALADDSGLEVDYLNGEPGIYSARYLGRDTDYDYKNNYIINKLSDAKEGERSARFVCVISLVLPDGREFVERGVVEGLIGYEQKGENGFGYDPIFYLPEYGKTSAELSPEEKNKISHRGKALSAMKKLIMDLVDYKKDL
jgi:non-canonical purine NTP pyrophosphatase, rdgB/HAM1 family